MQVKVLVRVRPLLKHEVDRGERSSLLTLDASYGKVGLVNKQGGVSNFAADHVCGTSATQDDIFRLGALNQLVGAVAEGYNATVFAYGQTGSGKTFTMEGYDYAPAQGGKAPAPIFDTPKEKLGIVPRTVHALFDALRPRAAAANAPKYRVLCHFVQIYKEQVLDLLNPASSGLHGAGVFGGSGVGALHGLKLRWSPEKEFFVDNLFIEEVETAEAALDLFQRGVKNKRVAETRMNTASSRSHCMLTLQVQQLATDRAEHVLADGRLTLVDLAGSERQQALLDATSKAGMAESVQINKSLFTLRKVILSLSELSQMAPPAKGQPKPHVPYRDSTLTRLLKHALGGNSHTLMVACISPSDQHSEENASTLAYAARARAITNAPVVNLDPHTAQVAALKKEILRLKAEVQRLQQIIALGDHARGGGNPMQIMSQQQQGGGPGGELLLSGPIGTGSGPSGTDSEASAALTMQGGAGGGEREAALSSLLAQEQASGAAQATALQQGVALAKSLAATNGQLREAFDKLAEQRDSLEAAHGLLVVENTQQRERLALLELTLAMESYPSQPFDSMQARVEMQLRAAAQEVVALRNENASLRDQMAMHHLLEGSGNGGGGGGMQNVPPQQMQQQAAANRPGTGGRRMPSKKGGGPQYGLKPQQQAQQPPPEPPPPPPAPISLSSTGMLAMSSAWMPPPPPSAGGSAGSRTCVGSATYHEKTVPRLMPDVGDGVVTSVDEVDQLTQLLRKRAEMKQSRPSTAGTRNHMNGRYGS